MALFKKEDYVRIKSGPFTGFTGVVAEADATRKLLRVRVEIFGRHSTIEINFSEAEQVPPRPPLTSLN